MGIFTKPKLGIALGGGGGKGWAHIGVLKVLEREKIKIHAISGTSSGALIAAFYAAGKLQNLEEFLLSIDDKKKAYKLFDLSYSGAGFIKGYRISKLIDDLLGDIDFLDLNIPLAISAVDLISGEEIYFHKKDLKLGIRASISVPGIMKPVPYNKRLLIDGGILNPVPVSYLERMGCQSSIAVDLSGLELRKQGDIYLKGINGYIPSKMNIHEMDTPSTGLMGKEIKVSSYKFGIYDIIIRSISIMQNKMHYQNIQKYKPDLILSPKLDYFKFMEIHKTREAVEEGEKIAYANLPKIKKISSSGIHRLFSIK